MFNITSLASSSAGNCYVISKGTTHILIECGLPYKKLTAKLYEECKLAITDISACFVSHEHADHSRAASDIAKNIPVFSTKNTSEKKKRVTALEEFELVVVDGIKIKTLPVNHGETPCFGFHIYDDETNLIFLTDLNLFEYKFNVQLDQIMIECNFMDNLNVDVGKTIRQINTHLSLGGTIKHLEHLNLEKCKEIYLMHLSDDYSDEIIMKATIEQTFGIKTKVCKKDGGVW